VQLQGFYDHATASTVSEQTYNSKSEEINIFSLKITNFITSNLFLAEKFCIENSGSEDRLKI